MRLRRLNHIVQIACGDPSVEQNVTKPEKLDSATAWIVCGEFCLQVSAETTKSSSKLPAALQSQELLRGV